MGVDGDQDIWFQPIFMLLPKCVWLQGASSAPAGKRWVSPIAEGPTELRAPGPRDPTIRHCPPSQMTGHMDGKCGAHLQPNALQDTNDKVPGEMPPRCFPTFRLGGGSTLKPGMRLLWCRAYYESGASVERVVWTRQMATFFLRISSIVSYCQLSLL